MKTWPFAVVVGLGCLAALGCRVDPAIELLERQNRILEDEIYRLREQLADRRPAPRAYPAEAPSAGPLFPDRGRFDLDRTDSDRIRLPEPPPQITRPAAGTPPPSSSETPPAKPPLPGTLGPLQLQPGEPLPEGKLPGLLDKYRSPTDPGEENPAGSGRSDEGDPDGRAEAQPTSVGGPLPPADSSRATQLVLNRLLSGGYDSDGRPGDEGIVVVIEPRDDRGRRVEAPAPVSVVVLDPALDGEDARVARWDFTAEQTAAISWGGGSSPGLDLQMGWPDAPPVHEELHVFVRYVTSDGRNLQTDDRIHVELPDGRTAGWVPRPEPPAREPQPQRPPQPLPLGPPPTAASTSPSSPRTAASPLRPRRPEQQRPAWSPDRP